MVLLQIESLPDPSDRFELGEELATGSWGQVCFTSKNKQANHFFAQIYQIIIDCIEYIYLNLIKGV